MRDASHPHAPQHLTETILFGGYEPDTRVLKLTVEASSLEEAGRRMIAVALLVGIERVEHLIVLVMERPSLAVPLFMEGFFKATRLGMVKEHLRAETSSEAK